MLEFDNNTLANMTAALDHGCKLLPLNFDTAENRKRIGDAVVGGARSGKRTLLDLSEVARHEVKAIIGPKPSILRAVTDWFAGRV